MEMDTGTSTKHIRVSNAVAAGTTDVETTAVDRQGFEIVKWTASFGTLSASSTNKCKVQQSDASGSGFADLADSETTAMTPTTDDNKMQVIYLVKPSKRYVRLVVDRGGGNSVIDSVVAELYGCTREPVTDDSSTLDEKLVLVGPAEGTA